jgi:hypothetical protein
MPQAGPESSICPQGPHWRYKHFCFNVEEFAIMATLAECAPVEISAPRSLLEAAELAETRVPIRVTWRRIPGISDGATAPFAISRTLSARQISMLPPPLSVRQAQLDLSEQQVGIVHDGRPLDGELTLDELIGLLALPSDAPVCFELMPAVTMLEQYGFDKLEPAKPSAAYSPSVKTRHMTSVQLMEFLRHYGVERPDGPATSRNKLRQLAEGIERRGSMSNDET